MDHAQCRPRVRGDLRASACFESIAPMITAIAGRINCPSLSSSYFCPRQTAVGQGPKQRKMNQTLWQKR